PLPREPGGAAGWTPCPVALHSRGVPANRESSGSLDGGAPYRAIRGYVPVDNAGPHCRTPNHEPPATIGTSARAPAPIGDGFSTWSPVPRLHLPSRKCTGRTQEHEACSTPRLLPGKKLHGRRGRRLLAHAINGRLDAGWFRIGGKPRQGVDPKAI